MEKDLQQNIPEEESTLEEKNSTEEESTLEEPAVEEEKTTEKESTLEEGKTTEEESTLEERKTTEEESTMEEPAVEEKTTEEASEQPASASQQIATKAGAAVGKVKAKVTKKFSLKKLILGTLATILVCLLLAVLTILLSPGIQMKFMTNYVMENLRTYNWSALQMEDPVRPGLVEAFGQNNTESVDLLYAYMKEAVADTTWEISEINKEDLTATVTVRYTDRSAFLTEYGKRLGDYIIRRLDDGTMKMNDMTNILNLISDEENQKLMNDSMERVFEETLGIASRQLTTMDVHFERNHLICIPTGTSEEVNDVASAGMISKMDGMTNVVAARIIPQVIDRVFKAIQEFDEAEIEKYTGSKISEFLNMKEDDQLYQVLVEYLRACAGKMTYQVGDFDQETGKIEVNCSYLDSKNVITRYVKLLAKYSLQSLLTKKPGKIDNAMILKEATESADEERQACTVTITLDTKNYGSFDISDEIMDVVSANLYSEMSELMKYIK
ncbi:MAG: hypothetical protein MJ097_02065 [Dorea sp.]|nr:hypothetical protein [Dorea sp.]